jgi:hypothetical protein
VKPPVTRVEGEVTVEVMVALLKKHAQVNFTFDGPYLQFGMPVSVGAKRDGAQWEFHFTEYGDGAGPCIDSHKRVEEAELRQYVVKLLAGGCPIKGLAGVG